MLVRKLNEKDYLIRNKKVGIDPLVDKILADEEGITEETKFFKKGVELRDSKLRRSYIESCILASNDFQKIGELLELDPKFVEFYENVFYNVSGLDRLERLELLEDEEDTLKLWAVSQGLDFIAWRLGKKVELSPIEGLKDLFSTCIYKSKEAMFNKNASEASREAAKWTKLAMDLGRLLKMWVMDTQAAKKDLELALEKVVPNFGDLEELDFELDLAAQEFASMTEAEEELDLQNLDGEEGGE